jgi:hypothetical protein
MSVYKRGDVWVADFYLGGRNGRRVRRAAPTKELAEALRGCRSPLRIEMFFHTSFPASARQYAFLYWHLVCKTSLRTLHIGEVL